MDLLFSCLFTFFGIEDGGLVFAFGFFAPLSEVDAAGLAARRFAEVTEGVGVFWRCVGCKGWVCERGRPCRGRDVWEVEVGAPRALFGVVGVWGSTLACRDGVGIRD